MKLSFCVRLALASMLVVTAQAEPAPATPPDLGDINSKAAKKQVYRLAEGTAEVDGTARPELGKSITDSLAEGLLADDQSRLVGSGVDQDHDFVLSSRLVGEQGTYRLTVRKTTTDEQIVAIYSATSSEVFGLADEVLQQISPRSAAKAETPVLPELDAPSPPSRSAWLAVPSLSGPKAKTVTKKPSPVRQAVIHPRPVYERERVGVIKAVNDEWDFVVITSDRGAGIKTHEILEILYDGPQGTSAYAKLEIDRIDGNRIVANFGGDSRGRREIFPGEIVYSWRRQ